MQFWKTMVFREKLESYLKVDNQHYAMQMPYYLVPTINSTDASSETVSGGYYVLVPYAQGIEKKWK